METKYLIRNKKKYRGLFTQFTHTGTEVINLIKKEKLDSIDIIYKVNIEPLELGGIHYRFYISIESKDLKIVELLIKDLKIDGQLTEDKILKLNNLEKFSKAYAEFIKDEYNRYFKKYSIKNVEIRCVNGFSH
ncbi:hypothetical protein NSA50_14375 [Clostridium sp. DSM 100503]|uniref:hypothetical protein n=1 Tax=Clostridium sp. DSM 100503 TaxID=2963282 RepID=UPI002149A750|nr:hypothetical protein [Clostridium sp. DSM 100503]MCR1952219.1 hypothetical protein [Clostridium sp. DSM 100503]